jgi:ParB/RepB/Spo0J family partition protein
MTTPATARVRGRLPPVPESPFHEISIAEIRPNPHNPRKTFAPEDLSELAASIKEHGILEPLVVTEDPAGGYVIVCGERRWRAAQEAGLEKAPCLIKDLAPGVAAEVMLVENLQRRDLDAMEEARAFRALLDDHGYTQEKLAEKIGVSPATVTNRLRLLRLPEDIQEAISKGKMAGAAGLELLRLETAPQLMREVADGLLRDGGVTAKEAARSVVAWARNKGRTLEPREWNSPKFDVSGCEACPSMVRVASWNGESASRVCLNGECWDKKNKAAEQEAAAAKLAELKSRGDKPINLDKMSYSDFVRFDYQSEWQGIDQAGCQGCEKRRMGKQGSAIHEVCIDPLCHRKKQRAATRVLNAAKKTALEAEMDDIHELADRHGWIGGENRPLIFLVALLIQRLHNEYDRPAVTAFLKRTFGWEDKFWGSSWDMRGAFQTVIERLQSLTAHQLIALLLEWPAVALGTKDPFVRWALRMDEPEAETPATEIQEPDAPAGPAADPPAEEKKPGAGEFANFQCPGCETEMEYIVVGLEGPPFLRCVNEDCRMELSEEEAREILRSDMVEMTAEEVEELVGEDGTAPADELPVRDELAGLRCPEDGGLVSLDESEEPGRYRCEKCNRSWPKEAVMVWRWSDPATGKTYEVSRGLGTQWGLFERKENGSLRRVKAVDMTEAKHEAISAAINYAREHGWKMIHEEAGQAPGSFPSAVGE